MGSKRKNYLKEKELSSNIRSLKRDIQETLNEEYSGEFKEIELTVIKPSRGLTPKFNMDNIRDKEIRKILKANFGDNLRKLTTEEIQNNLCNY
ncbi:hypothetical protein [Aquimarina atlantica]|uniref:hypothetical protein n=1 Tax=Aquimarina atlantica TaxID=1317122 RepID=UPI00103E6523|nr:hypothetical protein [Aquimarina atlantica]